MRRAPACGELHNRLECGPCAGHAPTVGAAQTMPPNRVVPGGRDIGALAAVPGMVTTLSHIFVSTLSTNKVIERAFSDLIDLTRRVLWPNPDNQAVTLVANTWWAPGQ